MIKKVCSIFLLLSLLLGVGGAASASVDSHYTEEVGPSNAPLFVQFSGECGQGYPYFELNYYANPYVIFKPTQKSDYRRSLFRQNNRVATDFLENLASMLVILGAKSLSTFVHLQEIPSPSIDVTLRFTQ